MTKFVLDNYCYIIRKRANDTADQMIATLKTTENVVGDMLNEFCDTATMDSGVDAYYNKLYAMSELFDILINRHANDFLLTIVEESMNAVSDVITDMDSENEHKDKEKRRKLEDIYKQYN